jgi:hypothetical protein
MKGHGFWTSPYPYISLFPHSLSFSMGLLARRERCIGSHECIVLEIFEMEYSTVGCGA